MPRALDLATSLSRTAAPQNGAPRSSRNIEPADRFDRVLDRQSRTAPPSDKPTPKASETAGKADASKATPKDKKINEEAETEAESTTEVPEEESATTESKNESADEQPNSDLTDDLILSDVDGQETPNEDGVDPELADEVATLTQAQIAGEAQAAPVQTQAVASPDADAIIDATEVSVKIAQSGTAPASTPIATGTATKSPQAEADIKPQVPTSAPIATPDNTDAGSQDAEGDTKGSSGVVQNPTPGTKDTLPGGAFVLPMDPADASGQESQSLAAGPKVATPAPTANIQPVTPAQPEQRFVENNVDRIVTHVKSDLTPNGGSMKIRLDPPRLGQLQIDITVDDGLLTASFRTTNDEATRLLSHSLSQLKSSLEQAGLNVDRIQVRQAAPGEQTSSNRQSSDQDQQQQQQNSRDTPDRQEQQRREMIQRMWAKLGVGEAPLDLVA
jgi:flagellar hook-length control protein FliK